MERNTRLTLASVVPFSATPEPAPVPPAPPVPPVPPTGPLQRWTAVLAETHARLHALHARCADRLGQQHQRLRVAPALAPVVPSPGRFYTAHSQSSSASSSSATSQSSHRLALPPHRRRPTAHRPHTDRCSYPRSLRRRNLRRRRRRRRRERCAGRRRSRRGCVGRQRRFDAARACTCARAPRREDLVDATDAAEAAPWRRGAAARRTEARRAARRRSRQVVKV